MDEKALQEKKAALEARYKELEATKQNLIKQTSDIAAEQLRLDGEYRLINEMLNPSSTNSPKMDEPEVTKAPETPAAPPSEPTPAPSEPTPAEPAAPAPGEPAAPAA